MTICKNLLARKKYHQNYTDILLGPFQNCTPMGFTPRAGSDTGLGGVWHGPFWPGLWVIIRSEHYSQRRGIQGRFSSARHHPAFGAKGKMSSGELFQTLVHSSHFHSLALSREPEPAIHCFFLLSSQSPQAVLLASVFPLALSVSPKKLRKPKWTPVCLCGS